MPHDTKAAAVLYAKNLERMSAFYAAVGGLQRVHAEKEHVVLESPTFQLVIVAIPERIAASIVIDSPPVRRESTPIKLVLHVQSIAEARAAAAKHGAQLDAPEREWPFREWRVCDGHDPEGNVVQFRESAL